MNSGINILVLLFLTLVFNSEYCLSTDSEQNIEIEADTDEMDDVKNITTYRGNVIVTQGSIRMSGHTMTVYFDDNSANLTYLGPVANKLLIFFILYIA